MSQQRVCRALQEAGDYLSGQELSRTLGISRAAVWKAVEALRRQGYDIEARTGRGYRLVGAFIKIPLGYSSITLQFFFTAMAGCLLGPYWGAASQGVYVLLGLVGLPIFTLGGGFGYVFQPTFGFLLGLIPSALVIGLITRKNRRPLRIILACAAGLATLYAVGLPYMGLILNVYLDKGWSLGRLLRDGMLLFLPGDALKIAVAAILFPKLSVFFDKKQ